MDDVPTIKESAALLDLAKKTGEATAQAGELPFNIRGHWHIKGAALDQWIDAHPHGGDGSRNGE